MNNIDQYKDFTGTQNTRYADTGTKLDLKKHKDFNYNEALRRTGDAKAAARRDKNLSKIVDEIEGVLAKKSDKNFSPKDGTSETVEKIQNLVILVKR